MPILSNCELQLNDDIVEFVLTHIEKIMIDQDLRDASFTEESEDIVNWSLKLRDNHEEFVNITSQISQKLYELMIKNVDIPAGDCMFVLMQEGEEYFLCLLKLAYTNSYIHFVEQDGENNMNTIIKQKTALPNINQKVNEAFIINLNSLELKLKEKEFEIDGLKEKYLSKLILKCDTVLTQKEQVSIVNKAAKKFVKKFYDDDVEKMMEVKKIVVESINDQDQMDLERVAAKISKGDDDLRHSYMTELEKKGINEPVIIVDEEKKEKIFKKQKIVTDTGVEIKLPYDYIDNAEKIEFINNSDGTISILIKDVTKMLGK